jgi:hypothetical protein
MKPLAAGERALSISKSAIPVLTSYSWLAGAVGAVPKTAVLAQPGGTAERRQPIRRMAGWPQAAVAAADFSRMVSQT